MTVPLRSSWQDRYAAQTFAEQNAIARAKGRLGGHRIASIQPEKPRVSWLVIIGHDAPWWREAEPLTEVDEADQELRDEWRMQWLTKLWLSANGHLRCESDKTSTKPVFRPELPPEIKATGLAALALPHIQAALNETGGNSRRAAELLGLSPRQICYFVNKYGLKRWGNWDNFAAKKV